MSLVAYRHFHEESNIATAVTVALSELGLSTFDPEVRGQELQLHGLLQTGRYSEGRGVLLSNAVRYLRDLGVNCQILHDPSRTTALYQRLVGERPDFHFQLLADLQSPGVKPIDVERDLSENKLLILVDSRAGLGRLPIHVLLARLKRNQVHIMNSDTGQNHICSVEHLKRHLHCPISFGATAFAGWLYLYTGLAISLSVNLIANAQQL